jgi:A/G-specific adenine glycosylase
MAHIPDKNSFFYEWAAHDDDSFHDLDVNEAIEIRLSLLAWYDSNRRKLPWRGDPPPYDGSTAGINKVLTRGGKLNAEPKSSQPKIKEFFVAKAHEEKVVSQDIEKQSVVAPIPVSAYGVWVSEIMLQQTRVEAVIPYYLKWMKSFPTVVDLANASEEDVNSHWAGLGFYRRARLLHQGAKLVVDEYEGKLPESVDELMKINGIGQYTASAIASIAFDVNAPVVDGNVCRVLSRLRAIANNIKAPILKDKLGWRIAKQIVDAGDRAGDVNQALMELGATLCAPSGTGLDERDPLRKFYLSTKLMSSYGEEYKRCKLSGNSSFPSHDALVAAERTKKRCCLCAENKLLVLEEIIESCKKGEDKLSHGPFPLPPPKTSKTEEVLAVAVLKMQLDDGEAMWLLVKRPKSGLLAGQWEFPSVCVWSSATDEEHKGKERKRKIIEVPFINEQSRSIALTKYLSNLTEDCHWMKNISQGRQRNKSLQPIEHVFSHIRHTMWIEHQIIFKNQSNTTQWTSSCGKELRWMSQDDMDEVGVTSGVKKILNSVKTKKERN